MIEKVTETHHEWYLQGKKIAEKTLSKSDDQPQNLYIYQPPSMKGSDTWLLHVNHILKQYNVISVNHYQDSDGNWRLYIGNTPWNGYWRVVWTTLNNIGPISF